MPFKMKFPLLLPSKSYVTDLIIRDCHDKVFHNGVRETLSELRSRYWIVKGRQRIKAVLRGCSLCRIVESLPYPAPVTADLPEFRLDGGIACTNIGVDFFGPLYVKEIYDKQMGKMHKAYVVLFTCATSRMVHLEICPTLTTDAYIRSMQRFISRRGTPKLIISDNGRTFKGIELKRFCSIRGITWKFNLAQGSLVGRIV